MWLFISQFLLICWFLHIFILSTGLELNNKYDIVSFLSKANVVPGRGYSGQEIVQKLTSALGKKPGTQCNVAADSFLFF